MRIAAVALTRNGSLLAVNLGLKLGARVFLKKELMPPESHWNEISPINSGFTEFIGELFKDFDALILVMACGIAVRAIAPYIKDKTRDPAVVVMDEKGMNIISLISGHIGGANSLTRRIAAITGGNPVITTATDINGVVAFDIFALKNDCTIENIKALKTISAALVNGETIALYTDSGLSLETPENIRRVKVPHGHGLKNTVAITNRTDLKTGEETLLLRPRNLILGIGCKRGTTKDMIEQAVINFMETNKRSLLSLKRAASIDIKRDEPGILDFCRSYSLEPVFVPREDIEKIEADYKGSVFVKSNVGVSCVAEPCSVLASGKGRLIAGKMVCKGITLALYEEERTFRL